MRATLALLLIVAGIVIAVLGNGLQERIADGIPKQAVAEGRVGTPLSVDPKGEDIRLFAGRSSLAGNRLLEALECTTDAEIDRPQDSAGKYNITKVGDYSLIGTVETGKPFELSCRATSTVAAELPLYATTGGGKAGVAVFPLVGGIILACSGGGLLIASFFLRRRGKRTLG